MTSLSDIDVIVLAGGLATRATYLALREYLDWLDEVPEKEPEAPQLEHVH